MNLTKYIPNAVTSTVGRSILKTQKHSPTLLFASGLVGFVGTVVLASRATLKLEEVLDDANSTLGLAEEIRKREPEKYSEEEMFHDKNIILAKAAIKVVKLYAPALIVGGLSIAALTGSHKILTNRNFALSAAYSGLEKAFEEYRARVREDVGEDKEREYRHGVEETTIETKNGKKKIRHVGSDGPSMYAKFFRPDNVNYCDTPEYNILFLRAQQNFANQRLQANGHIFLNEVYDALGLDRTSAGQVVGWIKGYKDDSVNFGIFDGPNMDRLYDFVTNREGEILLDFNVDGEVYKLI